MPIRADLKHFYSAPAWLEARAAVVARSGNCCERCKVPNGIACRRSAGFWIVADGPITNSAGERVVVDFPLSGWRLVRRIVLTVAHLDHDPSNNDLLNLNHLCQWWHLAHDKKHHIKTARARRWAERSKGQTLLFESEG